jgi:hypothetical protein
VAITIVNSIHVAHRRIVWSDAAQIGPDGRLVTIAPNCLEFGEGRLLLAARCIGDDELSFIYTLEARGATIDLLARNGELVFERHLSVRKPVSRLEKTWVSGWSELFDQALLLEFDPLKNRGQRVTMLRSLVSHQLDLLDRPAINAVLEGASSPEEVDLPAFGRALAQAQRSQALSVTSDGMLHHDVGGYLLQTEIALDGIRHEIIHQWPDQVGELIEPFGVFHL